MYAFSSTVRFSECGPNRLLTIPALINYLQDCSTFHTESIGRGIDYCNGKGFAWFIAAWQIEILRLPRFTEDIRVSTWCYVDHPTLANRNFLMETAQGEPLVQADSLWFPFSHEQRRPIRIPASELDYLSDERRLNMPPTQRKLKLTGMGEPKETIAVTMHHLDTNRHVNNGQYIAMADTIVRAQEETFELRRLCVQYKKAAQLGDTIVPSLYAEDNGYAVDLADERGTSFAIVRMER